MTSIVDSTGSPGPRLTIVQLSDPSHLVGLSARPGATLTASINPASLDSTKEIQINSASSSTDGTPDAKTLNPHWDTVFPHDDFQDKYPKHTFQLRWDEHVGVASGSSFTTARNLVSEWCSKLPRTTPADGAAPAMVPGLKCLFDGSTSLMKVYGVMIGYKISITKARVKNAGQYFPVGGVIEVEILEIPGLRSNDA